MYTTPRGQRATAGSAGSLRRPRDGCFSADLLWLTPSATAGGEADQVTAPTVTALTGDAVSGADEANPPGFWTPLEVVDAEQPGRALLQLSQ